MKKGLDAMSVKIFIGVYQICICMFLTKMNELCPFDKSMHFDCSLYIENVWGQSILSNTPQISYSKL